MPELIAIGVGPGDPELLTVKGLDAIRNAEIIACPASAEDRPSIALSVVSPLLGDAINGKEIVKLVFPMTRDRDTLENTWRQNAEIMAGHALTGRRMVYLTVGDPYLYSTWIYMGREISQKHPEIKIKVIPGIVSIFSFTSKAGISLAEGAEKITVVPSCYDLSQVGELARNSECMVFLKDGRYFDDVIRLLRESGFPEDSLLAIGQDLGTDHEIIQKITLGGVDEGLATKYFSIMVVKRA